MNKAIVFSLWGTNPKYTIGAVKNAQLAKSIYPDWKVIFYIDNTVPQNIVNELVNLNCIIIKKNVIGNWLGLFWRFEAMCDQTYDVVISRDTDSRLSMREKNAVDEWISSGKTLHIMRDHPWHHEEILGGMWGLRNKQFSLFKTLLDRAQKNNNYNVDQIFLKKMIFSSLKNDCYVHDEFLNYNLDKHPFPTPRINYEFVGQVFFADDTQHIEYLTVLKNALNKRLH